jgi:hypothetical protein
MYPSKSFAFATLWIVKKPCNALHVSVVLVSLFSVSETDNSQLTTLSVMSAPFPSTDLELLEFPTHPKPR